MEKPIERKTLRVLLAAVLTVLILLAAAAAVLFLRGTDQPEAAPEASTELIQEETEPEETARAQTPVPEETAPEADGILTAELTDLAEQTAESGATENEEEADSTEVETIVPEETEPEADTTPPEITLYGGTEVELFVGEHFYEMGYKAVDDTDGDLTWQVAVEAEEICWYLPGEHTIRYTVTDSSGNTAEAVRTVSLVPSPRFHVIEPEGKVIYLTFDDGPCPDTLRLLDVLDKYNVKATFFVVDTGYPEILQRIAQDGHSLGIHTMTHNYRQIYRNPEAYFDDLFGMQQLILEATGQETWMMRFPGGSSNTISSFNKGIMSLLTEAVENMGFSYFDWNVDSDDAGQAREWREVFANVTAGAAENRISVVLQHDIHPYSVSAVEAIIRWGLDNGYTFLPLSIDSPAMHHMVLN